MALKKTFVLSDESINSYGFWIPVAGMDLSGVQKNCPLYYDHRTWEIPCGHVENIRLKDGKVLGDVIIEGGNDIEKEYIRKIENGDIKGCSLGIDPIEWSEDATLLKQGQTKSTLSKCAPYEVSLAPLPGNKNALAMRNGNDMITLSAEKKYEFIPDLNTQINMKELALLLGMDASATEMQLCEALKPLMLKAKNADAMQKVIEENVTEGLSPEQKAFFVNLSKTNIADAMQFLTLNKKAPAPDPEGEKAEDVVKDAAVILKKDVKVSDLIKPGANAAALELAKDGKGSFDYLQRHDSVELGRIKNAEPEKYAQMVADYAKGVRYKA